MSVRSRLLATVAVPILSVSLWVQPSLADMLARPVQVAQGDEDQPVNPHKRQHEGEGQQRAPEGQRPGGHGPAGGGPEGQGHGPQDHGPQGHGPEGRGPAVNRPRPQPGEQRQPEQRQPEQRQPEQKPAEPKQPQEAPKPAAPAQNMQRKAPAPVFGEPAPKRHEPQGQQGGQPQPAQLNEQNGHNGHGQPQGHAPKPQGGQPAQQPGEPKQPQNGQPHNGQPEPGQRPEGAHPSMPQPQGRQPGQPQGGPQQDGKPGEQHKGPQGGQMRGPQGEPGSQPGIPGPGAPRAQNGMPGQPQPQGGPQNGKPGGPASQIIDKHTLQQKQEIAKDPAKTPGTVVLPVQNGAAVLDSDKDADNFGGEQSRQQRRRQRQAERVGPPPASDAAAQAGIPANMRAGFPKRIQANLDEKGTRVSQPPAFAFPVPPNMGNRPGGPGHFEQGNFGPGNGPAGGNTVINNVTNNITNVRVVDRVDNRVVYGEGNEIFVRGDDRPRLRRDATQSYYEQLPGGRQRETIIRPGGYRIVTIYDRYGDIEQRTRIDPDGSPHLMIFAPPSEDTPDAAVMDVGYELPPMRLAIPVSDYIIDVADNPDRDYYRFLEMPPVEPLPRVYTIDEVRNSARLRDMMRRIDLDTIHFATGSADISQSEAESLRQVGMAMQKILSHDPTETFLIEGHTDAVGSASSNLVLSDRRAESVADALTNFYSIPPENLVTQGYGERFLKIDTQGPEAENRRVTIRRITPLIRPVVARQ
ncbi:MAG: OmpA family protein [Rhizobiales bacterium]|nr:OmpA family protein [Hyphomicrobiales bacterium]OJY01459.1 MAG: hypothetical protein BGP07_12490 [Rhizobiales bacterium 63-22]